MVHEGEHKENRMKPWHKWPGLIVALMLLAACQQSGDDTTDEEATDEVAESETDSDKLNDEEEEAPAMPVETAVASRGDIYATYSGTAPVEAFADATVVAKVGGEVREIFVEEGDDVKAGQLLARLDGDRLRLEQKQTEANLRKLQRDHQRNVDLRDRGLISDGDFEKIMYDMEALEATNKLAMLQLSYSEIRTPINGVVSERFIKIGNMLEVDAQTFTVTSLEPLISYLHVPEREYRKIIAGQNAAMIVDALGGAIFPAKVARISPVVDPATGTFKITIEVNDDTRRLKPGMFARIAIVHDMHANVLQVPRSALIDEVGTESVFVVEDDVAIRRVVETGFTNEGRVEISSGITDTDNFVIIGQAGLKDGAKVIVINTDNIAEAAADNDHAAESE